jgi:hypothetical protein
MAIHELNLSKEEAIARFEVALAKMPPSLAEYYRRCVNFDDPGEGALWMRQGVEGAAGATIGALQEASLALISYSNFLVLSQRRGQ